jgi:hypothetical protein
MTTHSDTGQIAPYWFGRPEAEIRAAVDARPEAWAAVPGYSRYEWSDKGQVRRTADARPMKTGVNNSEYEVVKILRDSDGKQVGKPVAHMVILAHHPAFHGLSEFPEGMETRHNPAVGDKLFNAYPEGIWPGTKLENAEDQFRSGRERAVPRPERACIRCGEMFAAKGRRCPACREEIGRQAAAMLNAGVNLDVVNVRSGYRNPEYVYQLAVTHGGYEGTLEQAQAQGQARLHRVTATVRHFLRLGRR